MHYFVYKNGLNLIVKMLKAQSSEKAMRQDVGADPYLCALKLKYHSTNQNSTASHSRACLPIANNGQHSHRTPKTNNTQRNSIF
jgi:hypothetical protein